MPKLDSKSFVLYWLPVIAWIGIIAIESTTLFSSANTGSFVVPILHKLFPSLSFAQLEEIHHLGRKVGHFTGYGILGYLIFRAIRGTQHVAQGTGETLQVGHIAAVRAWPQFWHWSWAVIALLGTCAVASADEIHQMFMPSRTGMWRDVVLDTSGAAFFLVITRIFAYRKSGRVTND